MTTKTCSNKLFSILVILWVALLMPSYSLSQQTGDYSSSTSGGYYPELKMYEVQVPVTRSPQTQTLYSWSLRNVDIKDVMLTFAKGSKINIVVEPGVEGTVTVDFNKVTFEDALKYILEPLKLTYAKEGKFIRVFQPTLQTKIFKLDYVNTQRSGSGSLSASGGGSGGSSLSISSSTSMNFWAAAVDALSTIVFGSKGGSASLGGSGGFSKEDESGIKLVVSPQAGIVMVTALEEKLEEVENFIKELQSSVERQVLIQAKIVEVTLSDDFELGINWSHVGSAPMNGILSMGTGGGLNAGLVPSLTENTFRMGITNKDSSFLLDAMATQGNLNVLSSPQIVTLNNQTAMIKVTREDVFFEITTTIDDETSERTETISPKTVDIGIVLDVTPQISDSGTITLNIHPSISEAVATATSKLGDEMPIIDRRETNTVVKVQDGQTIIMAGLMKEKNKETLKMTPCLGEIPILGALFRRTDQEKEKVELVIMLTPLVLNKDRIDAVHRYKKKALKNAIKPLHLGVPPHSQGLMGEFE